MKNILEFLSAALPWICMELLLAIFFVQFEGVDQESILKAIQCPVVYLKARTKYGKDGILWAANTDESADKVMRLLRNGKKKIVRSGHDIHFEKPRHFLKAMKMLEKML